MRTLSLISNNINAKLERRLFDVMHEITAQSNYSPFVFKDNYRKAENSTPTNLIIYDIDEGLTLDKAVTLCADFKSLIVTTKSHQVEKNGVVCDRFRVIIPLDEAPPKEMYKKFYTTLAEMLGIETYDKACVDLSRYFYKNPLQQVFYSKSERIIKCKEVEGFMTPDEQIKPHSMLLQCPTTHERTFDNVLPSHFVFKNGRTFESYEYLEVGKTEPIRCFNEHHEDKHPSAYVGRSKTSNRLMVTCKGCNETKFIHYEDFREALTVAHESKNDDINNSDIIAESDNNLPKITPDMLPNAISGWVKDICERIESPFEIGAVTALTLIGSLIGNKVGIRPKARDNWTEFTNLWGMIIGKPSIKKTPVYSELYKAIGKMEVEANEEHIEKLKQYELELELYENAKKEVKKSKNKEQVTIKDLIKPQMPVKKRYATSDGTIEAIADIINANPNGLLVSRDELSGFLKMMDKAGKEGDRAFYLEGWSGAGSFTVDRIMRGNTFIPRLTLSVLGNIQPSMVKEYVYEAVKGKKADGFLQRFQLCVFVDAIEQKGVDRLPNKTARDLYFNIIEKIAKKETFMGAEKDDFAETPFYRFRDDAQIVFNEWYRSNAKEAQNAFNEAMEGHLSKYPKLFTSLALIFHICDLMEDSSRFNYDISKENTLKALKLVEVFKAHAERLYSTFEVEEKRREDKADKILSFIGVNKLPISFRDITLKSGGKPCKDEILKAIKGVYKSAGSKVIARI